MNIKARLSQLLNPGFSHCGHCGITWNLTESKSLMYSNTSGFFPICLKCFHSPEVSYSDLMDFYGDTGKNRDFRFTTAEREYILNSLLQETKTDDIIKDKYQKYIALKRDSKIEKILS